MFSEAFKRLAEVIPDDVELVYHITSSLAEEYDFDMTSAPPIALPDEFNAAAYFIDRHIPEGRGAKVAIECGDIQVSYRQLFERVNQLGNGLRSLGVRIEERVFLLLLDTPEFAVSFFGAIKIGAIPVPVNTLLKPAD